MPSWVVVGASRGIGYQYLKTLSQNPSNIVIGLVRTPSSVHQKVQDDGLQNVHIIQGDLNDVASLNAAAAQVSQLTNGVLDHLILNGAYLSLAPLFLTPGDYVGKEALFVEELNNSMLTNVAGTLFSINAFMPLIKKSSIKKVIAISSALGDVEATQQAQVPDNITYSISKVAINLLIAKFAISYKDEGVIFLALNPGFVYTMTDSLDTMPPPVKPIFAGILESARKWNPDCDGPMMPVESVTKQLEVIEKLTLEQSGQFLGHRGDRTWV